MEVDKERFSSERYDGYNFPLRISPVKFGDSGRYFCFCESYPMASVTLVTVQVLVQYKYFLSGERQGVSLQAPAETNGTEFIWEWTSHDGSYTNARIITIQSNGMFKWNLSKLSITKQGKYDIVLQPKSQNSGVFTFIQTKPEKVNLSQIEVFTVKEPLRWSRENEGSDVTMSCEVSHLPDSATLDWERDREPTANTTLIYNNTAHIIIHSADRYSEGTYNCTLRWNGVLIFSIPRTLQVYEVSAAPPGGLSRNQSVVLNCEISQVIGSVTLAWLRMKGGRGELIKQEVLSEGHPKKMLSLTLPILSRDQLHWACVVFTESMLRAQVPLHLTLPTPISEPEEPKPGWSTETVVRVVIVVLATLGMLKVLMWYCRRRPAMLVQYKYFLSEQIRGVSLPAPAETNGTEFIWEWTSHDGSYTNTRIITIQSDGTYSWNLKESISKQRKYDIYLRANWKDAGVFTFSKTKPKKVKVAQFEVFAIKVEPLRWSRENEGCDVIRSCEVSHLPDSATLDWERDREPTANTTLFYNNTAHIIIHSVDQYSEGSYYCTLRWNGALIFSIPSTFEVNKGTRGTEHTLYRGSLNSSEVMLICRSPASYRTAYWQWEPSSGTNAIRVASADKYENASISMEVDKERFSSEGFDGSNFPLRISPVKFGDSGRYFCSSEHSLMATVMLVTVQVSAVSPGGLSRNQSVMLNCEISQVNSSVTLAWLRMKGGRGELVKQEVLSEGHPKKMLSLTLPTLSRDQLHWACAVFTGTMLRAQVPLTLPTPITEPEEPKPDNGWMLVIVLACTAAVCVGVLLLLGGLLFRRLKTAAGSSTSPAEGKGAADPVYSNITDLQQGQVDGNGDSSAASAVYSNVAELQKDQGTRRK
ncbi:uncharacterized protein LOC118216548 [Anguilla anguilla]|uniref:uncharacterized protein LOC118216548 n=1 Tax=Anguilla anguilla TaxID=7936 RepID=UPI0015B0B4D9|nr:uncharacterized protein LOC118216548 [Anguilla anguilla]